MSISEDIGYYYERNQETCLKCCHFLRSTVYFNL